MLDPADLADSPRSASSIKGATRSGRRVSVAELERVDLVSPAASRSRWTGPGSARAAGSPTWSSRSPPAGLIGPDTPVVTTVHELQLRAAGTVPVAAHDVAIDLAVTPDRVVGCRRPRRNRGQVRWSELTDEKIAAIPLLADLRR